MSMTLLRQLWLFLVCLYEAFTVIGALTGFVLFIVMLRSWLRPPEEEYEGET